jgi:NTP pyrophosphatase (non-canonical NTP hydrolase)
MMSCKQQCPWIKTNQRYITAFDHWRKPKELDAILKEIVEIKKELGDLMLHLVFTPELVRNDFDITDVLHGICENWFTNAIRIFMAM